MGKKLCVKELDFEDAANAAATEADLADAEAALGILMPEEVKNLYRKYNGIPEYKTKILPFHLLPLSEVLQINGVFRKDPIVKKYSLLCFWGDDESNYAGMFVDGPFRGRISFLDHEGYYVGDISPLFRSVKAFTDRVVELAERNRLVQRFFENGARDRRGLERTVSGYPYRYYEADSEARWHAMPTDYPPGSGEFTADDQLAYTFVSTALKEGHYRDSEERRFLVYCLARLTPHHKADSLFSFLAEDDLFIPDRVSHMLFLRRCEQAIPHIVNLAIRGNDNCRQSAEAILARFVVVGRPAVKQRVYREYAKHGSDTARLEAFIKAIGESPTLIYQG